LVEILQKKNTYLYLVLHIMLCYVAKILRFCC